MSRTNSLSGCAAGWSFPSIVDIWRLGRVSSGEAVPGGSKYMERYTAEFKRDAIALVDSTVAR
ncbi:transposase [Streptomyces sp. NBRC 110611]|nr:transposase [Streptomyces sp. NBRC 110611]